jgi:hypothetical protein
LIEPDAKITETDAAVTQLRKPGVSISSVNLSAVDQQQAAVDEFHNSKLARDR